MCQACNLRYRCEVLPGSNVGGSARTALSGGSTAGTEIQAVAITCQHLQVPQLRNLSLHVVADVNIASGATAQPLQRAAASSAAQQNCWHHAGNQQQPCQKCKTAEVAEVSSSAEAMYSHLVRERSLVS